MSKSHYTIAGEPPVNVRLRRSAQARRLSLRVSRLDGVATLTMPRFVPEHEAVGFLHEKEQWLRAQMARSVTTRRPSFGALFPVMGTDLRIEPGQGRAAKVDGAALLVPGGEEMLVPRLVAFLKLQARLRLREASDRYAAALGVHYGKISIRDTRSRWGSCTSEGNLMYSWRLMMAPEGVLDYVAAHEVAHLREMNHSPAYWKNVEAICPDFRIHRRWLRDHGQVLHAWDLSR